MSDRGRIPASVIKQYEPATHRRGASLGPLASSWFLSGLSLQWHRGRAGGMAEGLVTLFMCGDVMLGRGVDQILPHPGDPELREDHAENARAYVRLAERAHGPIPRPVRFSWPWGDALAVIEEVAPDARVINLETSVTHSARFAPGKPVHYRMSPENLPVVMVARPDACGLANNNVLDFGRTGLAETLDALAGAGLPAAGAGRDIAEAWQPAAVPVPGGSRAVVFACGAASSGIPPGLAATATRPGVAFLPRLSGAAADDLIADYERWSARCPSERPRARSSKSERAIPGTGRCERRSEILVRALALMTGVYRVTMLPQRA